MLLQAIVEMNISSSLYQRLGKYLRFDLLLFNIVDIHHKYEESFGYELLTEALNKYNDPE